MGEYEILSHVEMPECSIRIIGMKESEQVALHHHEKCAQIYTVLEEEVEARVGDRTMRLRPYETVRIEKGVRHGVRAVEGPALVLSLSIPPLDREDQHVTE
jgi:mannose-6-phosphate isomerase-like protein (cupin superfamily)